MSIDFSPELLNDDLIRAGHIIPVGVPGIFGRGPVFEQVLRGFDEFVSQRAAADQATRLSFPPCLDRKVLERSEYLDSFPQLAGTIFSFSGNAAQHQELMENVHEGRPWTHLQTMTAVCLTPAACYPVYPSFSGTLPAGGKLVDMQNWVFRNEPSDEPTRMQSFRVREFVRVGAPDLVLAWRDLWLQRGLTMLQELGLPAHSEVASDPFFGRGGRMLAANQREQELKFEVVVPVISAARPTALCSFNYHQDHFGKIFDIHTDDGAVAHTACLGFGLERIVMALFRTHGMVPAEWPAECRTRLGL
ncbi:MULTISPECIES: amino acid--[acyl-carrier-protein] ligase [unclassified Undibacterium]|uniref:amino acid--[acyl-carrier-protein] ligase n=1 Tax=unclassified Undibacterium TaxID=2630295 RepID=UPI002AC8CCD9|nr:MULTISPECIES: amino acid--[acyl-carrier-protein] ligase [unclassified Undibacterium]MEB0138982.1 amino acid--[acyl-carrier-protein] ligase [Undibacterium sp. CCC2.1]MEB0171923.1 amino acid--[acyl-carrier-protein] ligase [Undibacterium sp. CCC1.1]MEB0175864.1 amino acid--[acyl-carrier-protein] ligase [Undibacterium sp. CCC3.4]MEB0215070.1 amino acid--[acyl-carrier-protein] ligase [Undibacterium sp. 5I2]WPX45042.1 amino acid--[acyl-carrier-protein] ligase [Undibacterium sp. CCC3.4]